MTRDSIRRWCDRGERAHQDVRHKLMRWNVPAREQEELIVELIQDNLLNEERYASAFASDHFRLKRWGPRKIEHYLKAKGVSAPNIRKALEKLPREDSGKLILEILEKITPKYTGIQIWQKKQKAGKYLMTRGYSGDEVWPAVEQFFQKNR